MLNDANETSVPVVAPEPSSESETESYGYDGELIHRSDYSIVVPIVSNLFDSNTGINARRFLQTAIAIAADNDGRVVLLGIADVRDEAVFEQIREYASSDDALGSKRESVPTVITDRQRELAQVVTVAEQIDPDVPVRAIVRAVTDTTQGILDALRDGSEMAVLLLHGTGFDEGWLLGNSTIDTIVEEANCDVFVENVGVREGSHALYVPEVERHSVASLAKSEAETIDSILLPVGTGPHAALAAEAARAVARASDASVTVLHVITPHASGKERSDSKDLLQFADFVLGSNVESKTELREASDPVDAILQEAKDHDFTSIGSPEQKFRLRDLVFKPVQETLAGEKDVTVLMSRDADRTARSLYYRYKQAMGTEETDESSSMSTDGGRLNSLPGEDGPVLLPVFTDDVSREAVWMAADIAEHRGAELVIVGIEAVPEQTPLSHPTPVRKSQQRSQTYSRLAEEVATSSLEITSATRVGHGVSDIILREVVERKVQDLILEQTKEASSAGSLFGDPLNTIFTSADCNVALCTGVQYLNGISSVLVPVAGGPHSGVAVDVAKAVAAANDAWVEIFHVLDPEATAEEQNRSAEYVDAAMARLKGFERADRWVFEASDPADAIIEQAQHYSLTILGAPQKGRLRRFVFGSTTDAVSERAESSLITVRSREGAQNWFEHWIGRGT